MINIDLYLKEKREHIDRALPIFVPHNGPPSVVEAVQYSLQAGGKRLRPILTIATAETLGCREEAVIEVACSLEFIHTYSLIHDDLPAMDDSDLRRGIPSCHKAHGEAVAILAGDALLTHAFTLVSLYGSRSGNAIKANQITAELASAAGIEGMIGGQILDLEAEGKKLEADEIERLYRMKTGALLRASIICGALAAAADERQLSILNEFAVKVGTAFQIVDDLLDLESTAEELGKPVGADEELEKSTFPAVFGVEKARRKADKLYREALDNLQQINCDHSLLKGLAERMVYRKK